MNTLELRNIVIAEIEKIDDDSFLSALKTILESRTSLPKTYSEQYNEELKVAEEKIQNGNFYTHNEIKDKIEQWKKK